MADLPTNAEEVKAVIQEVTKPAGFPGEFTLGDGTIVKATSWEEAFQKVADMKSNTAAALRDREEQIRTLQAEREQREQVIQQQPSPTRGMTAEQQKKYWEYANQDPILADDYKDSIKYGIPMEQVASLEREVFNVTQYSADDFEIKQFMQSNPDFPGTSEASDIILNTLTQEGRPINKENLEYVYLRSVRDGLITPLAEEAPQQWTPPNLQGGGVSQRGAIDPFGADVPDDKLDEVARKLGLMH